MHLKRGLIDLTSELNGHCFVIAINGIVPQVHLLLCESQEGVS